MTEWIKADDPAAAKRTAEVIRAGGLVILPTDTVYGVGADWQQPDAVAALYAAKQRPPEKAIPVLLASADDIGVVASEVPANARRLADAFWPGPLTIVVSKRDEVPEIVSAFPTIGVRVPDHDATRAAIRACGGALAVTSANVSGGANAQTAQEAAVALGDAVALVLDGGECPGGVPSTVVDVSSGEIAVLREGPVSKVELLSAIQDR